MSISRKNSAKTELCIPEGNMKGKGQKLFHRRVHFHHVCQVLCPLDLLEYFRPLSMFEYHWGESVGNFFFQILQGHLPSKRLPYRQVQGKDTKRRTTFSNSKAKLSVKAWAVKSEWWTQFTNVSLKWQTIWFQHIVTKQIRGQSLLLLLNCSIQE